MTQSEVKDGLMETLRNFIEDDSRGTCLKFNKQRVQTPNGLMDGYTVTVEHVVQQAVIMLDQKLIVPGNGVAIPKIKPV